MSDRDRSRTPPRQRSESPEVINANVVLPAMFARNEMDDSPANVVAEEEEVEVLQDQPAADIAIESLLGGTPEQFDVSFAAIIKKKSGASHDCGALHRCQHASFSKGHHR